MVPRLDRTHVGFERKSEAQKELDIYAKDPSYENAKLLFLATYEGGQLEGHRQVEINLLKLIKAAGRSKVFFYDSPESSNVGPETAFSEEREGHMEQVVSDIVDSGGRVALFAGFVHASTAKRIIMTDGVEKTLFPKTLLLRLKERYGEDAASVDLRGCFSSFIDFCLPQQ